MAEKIICVVGPTACGKTKLGVLLAKRYDGEVVSADSMQIYKGMTIGTAAPTAEEMEGVPHHMIAVADPAEQWSAARYARAAVPIVDDILRRGKRPILVGGTGLWLDAVVQGRTFAGGHAGGVAHGVRRNRCALRRHGLRAVQGLRSVQCLHHACCMGGLRHLCRSRYTTCAARLIRHSVFRGAGLFLRGFVGGRVRRHIRRRRHMCRLCGSRFDPFRPEFRLDCPGLIEHRVQMHRGGLRCVHEFVRHQRVEIRVVGAQGMVHRSVGMHASNVCGSDHGSNHTQ